MPTYEYVCQDCEHKFEEFQSITADPVSNCPSCGQNKVKRLIGMGAGLIFKGSGFYQTDYRSESYKKAAEADKKSSSESSSSKSESSDSKSSDSGSKKATSPKKSSGSE